MASAKAGAKGGVVLTTVGVRVHFREQLLVPAATTRRAAWEELDLGTTGMVQAGVPLTYTRGCGAGVCGEGDGYRSCVVGVVVFVIRITRLPLLPLSTPTHAPMYPYIHLQPDTLRPSPQPPPLFLNFFYFSSRKRFGHVA
jgi:hypothetical protein